MKLPRLFTGRSHGMRRQHGYLIPALLLVTGVSCAGGDTPRWLENPEEYRKLHPLAKERLWTEFATPEQQKLFEGDEVQRPPVPATAYDLTGFDQSRLYSPVPAPGVHPRILFSPRDVPAIRKQLESTKSGQRRLLETDYFLSHTIYDASTGEGKIFHKLSTGDLTGLSWPDDETTNITNYFKGYTYEGKLEVHSGYFPRLMHAAAFRCLLEDDQERGTQVATAMANYWKLREPIIDKVNQSPDHPNDFWRPMHQIVAATHLGFGYDLAAKWMTAEQKTLMRRIIAKATSGKLAYGENGASRWRETNWTGWDLTHFLDSLAIEGEGSDPMILPVARETVSDYLTWAIDDKGVIYETNGKNGAGLLYALTSAQALARRGDNLLGHPHLRHLASAQVQDVVPQGGLNVNNGTWGCGTFSGAIASFLKSFYPEDLCADWLLRQAYPDLSRFDLKTYANDLANQGPTHGHPLARFELLEATDVFTLLDWKGLHQADGSLKEAWEREDLHLPLVFNDPIHGLLAVRTGNDKNALYMMFEARPDLRTVGHQHHDSGQFYLSALGQMWAVMAGRKLSYSADQNTVQIDGRGHSDVGAAPRVEYLPPVLREGLTLGVANLKNAYDYGWISPMHFSWHDPAFNQWKISPETEPDVVAYYRGTQHYKMRIWGSDYQNQNWGPTMRVEGNPVQYAFRTAGIIDGKNPYAIVLDDINKDGQNHRYDWLMQVPSGTRMIPANVGKENAPAAVLLTRQSPSTASWNSEDPLETLAPNEPGLIVASLEVNSTKNTTSMANTVGSDNYPIRIEQLAAPFVAGSAPLKTRLVITKQAVDPNFRVLMIPVPGGKPLPIISLSSTADTVTISWNGKKDILRFTVHADHLTHLELNR